jgi:autotransporter-associated beta strand protein
MKKLYLQSPALLVLVLTTLLTILCQPCHAGSAKWAQSPVSNYWGDSANWTPATVPSDIATFGLSNRTSIISGPTAGADSVVFDPGASAYTITVDAPDVQGCCDYADFGANQIINNSGIPQSFVVTGARTGGKHRFSLGYAGPNTTFTTEGSVTGQYGGITIFGYGSGQNNAGEGTFIQQPGWVGGVVQFFFGSTAGNANFVNNGGQYPGTVEFFDQTTAGNATFTNNGVNGSGGSGGAVYFINQSSADAATLIANGGTNGGAGGRVFFYDDSSGGSPRIELFGNGALDISYHNAPGVTIGNLEGSGNVFLGGNNLTINMTSDTIFSGAIQDGGGNGGTGGSLRITGAGTMTFSGQANHTGETTLDGDDADVIGDNLTIRGKFTILRGISEWLSAHMSQDVDNESEIRVYDCLCIRGIPPDAPAEVSSPSTSPSAIIDGNYTQSSGAILRVALSGTTPGSYGHISVGGDITLSDGAILTLAFVSNFAPQTGDTFNFLSGSSVTGSFSQVRIAGLQPGFQYSVAPDTNGNFNLVALNNGIAAPNLTLTSAVSRKTHGSAGTFDVNLPLTGTPGVECRSSGGNHTIVFTFTNNVTSGSALISGTGTLVGTPSFSGNTMTVNVSGVANAKTVNVALKNVTDEFSQLLPTTTVSMGVLVGDVNASRRTDAGDVTAVRNHTVSIPTDAATARFDVNASGRIDSGDVTATRNATVTVLPP